MTKRGISLMVSVVLIAGVVAFTLSIGKVAVNASNIALADQGLRVYFSAPLKEKSIEEEDLYVTNDKKKRIAADIVLSSNRQSVLVKGLAPGSYTFHMKKSALKGNKPLQKSKLSFVVQNQIESVSSAEELKQYFQQTFVKEKSSFFNGITLESSKEDSANDSGALSASHSTTNNQVEGVDEADIVKTDGNFIYSVLGNEKVVITNIQNQKEMKIASEIKIEENYYPSQLFIHDDTLIVLGDKYEPYNEQLSEKARLSTMVINGMTTVRLYDVSNREKPMFMREIATEGYMNGARKTGNTLYVITNVQPNIWRLEDIKDNDLRPRTYDTAKGDTLTFLNYQDIAILPGAMGPTYSVITAINLTSPKESEVVTKGYLGANEQLYMSADNLYLTATSYNETGTSDDLATNSTAFRSWQGNTELFKFSLNDLHVDFIASTEVKGTLLNQFSMDEHDNHFRVVTTEGDMWDDKNPSKNHLFLYDENLNMTGSVEGLAKGERIYSARFMGDKAYMVTFRETDPLFVIDVANPKAPQVLGELKIPGFSNYLHPLDEHHLIGFGYETSARKNPNGGEPIIETQGMKISLFDVSDFANPKEKDTEIIGGQGTSSPIQHDHKALFTHKKSNTYGFPVNVYESGTKPHDVIFKSSGALIYEITAENGIHLKGDLLTEKAQGQQYEAYEKEIQRILYSGDVLYTVSMNEIKSYSINGYNFVSEVGWK